MPHPQPCPDEPTLWRFLRDQLDGVDAEGLDDHIGGCPACQRALDSLVGTLPGRWSLDPDRTRDGAPGTRVGATSLGVMPRVLMPAGEPGDMPGPEIRPSSPEMTTTAERQARIHLFGEIARG